MHRRDFIAYGSGTVVALALPSAGLAQGRQFRIGVIAATEPTADMLKAFRDGMRERGYIEGQNLTLVIR